MENSKQKKIEVASKSLRLIEFQQKAILDNIPDIAWLKDAQSRFIAVNEPFAKACGFKVEEIIGKTDLDIWPKELALGYRADDQQVMESKKRKCVQEKLMYQEGGEQWIETIKTPLFDEQGTVIGTTGIARNITLHKNETERLKEIRAELELRVKVRTAELVSANETLHKEISEHKIAELVLIESEAKFKNIFENSRIGMVIADLSTQKFVLANQAFGDMFGYTNDELSHLGVKDIHPKEHLPLVMEKFKQIANNELIVAENLPIIKKDKSISYCDINSSPIIFNNLKCVLGNFTDVSERNLARQKTESSLSLLTATLEATADGILVVDLKGKVVDYNQKFLQLWNIPDSLILLKDDRKLLSYVLSQLQNPKAFLKEVQRLYADIQVKSCDSLLFKDGRIFERVSLPQKINEQVIGRVWSFRDVTNLMHSQNELKLNEEKFHTMVDFTIDWEYWQGVDKKMVHVSPSCQRITGYSSAEFMNDPDLIEKIVHQDDIEILRKKIKVAVNDGSSLDIEFRIVDRNNQLHWIGHKCTPIYSSDGKLLGRRGSNRDITKTKEGEFELKAYKDNLEILVQQRTGSLEQEIKLKSEIEEKANNLHQRLEFTLGATKTGLDIIDSDFNLCYVDPEWARSYGDWHGKKCFAYFMDRKSACPECAIEEAFRTKKVVISEEVLAKEGNRPIQVTTIPYQDKDGKWLVAEVNVDITQRRKVDAELKRYRDHLEELVDARTRELLEETNRYKNAELEKTKLNRELIKINEKLKSISLIDAHTGLYNYRYLQNTIEVEFHRARRYAQNLTLIMLDIDYFKSINDVYGIVFGDLVLKQLAKQLKRIVRRYDILIRYSGEEFVIISPRLNRDAGFIMAQRLLGSLNFINFGNIKHRVKLKMSLAVASFPDDRVKNGMDLVNLTNLLLNKAKESGGNRVYSTLDTKRPSPKRLEKITRAVGIESLKKTINKLTKQSKQGLSESIFAFAKTLELKDHYTGEHVENTVHFAIAVAKQLNLPNEEVELIKQAAMLHDLGKIGISENILLKKGKLNKREFAEIKKHPQIGADIIRPIQFLHDLIPFIFYHHERWDGKGYPTGIKGEDIPLGARVIAIADVYQALSSDRPYHKAFAKKVAIDIIKKSSGTQFDPRIVSAFLKIVDKKK